jgi:hypothetical protein
MIDKPLVTWGRGLKSASVLGSAGALELRLPLRVHPYCHSLQRRSEQ